ncbi:MAG: hypothetical protein V1794_03150 [Candidatus Glassbacteria bacterium]
METIIVPVDGASNIKLEVLDFHTFKPLFSRVAATPAAEFEGLRYNASGEQFTWYERVISGLPEKYKKARVVAPAARGASGGLVGRDGSLTEVPGRDLTLAYTQSYPERVDARFRELAGSAEDFFQETGSVRDYPGSLTLLKRFLFEELERPGVLERAECFAVYGALLAGHFLGPDYLKATRLAGNEHSYWMCHSGTRNINRPPGSLSSASAGIESFRRLVPAEPSTVYRPLGTVSRRQAAGLGLAPETLVVPGGHDTCLSHLPVLSACRRKFPGRPVIHLEAGSWTMVSVIGGRAELPADGYRRSVIVQGTVDGFPVVTSMYGGGRDFRYLEGLLGERGFPSGEDLSEDRLEKVLAAADCFVLPNVDPQNHHTGPFPWLEGEIVNRAAFFADRETAYIVSDLCMALTAALQIEMVCRDPETPVVLTAGGSKDPYFGRLTATISGRKVYILYDNRENQVSETTTLGAAVAGKAACLGVHPEQVDLEGLGLSCREQEPFTAGIAAGLASYRERFLELLGKSGKALADIPADGVKNGK